MGAVGLTNYKDRGKEKRYRKSAFCVKMRVVARSSFAAVRDANRASGAVDLTNIRDRGEEKWYGESACIESGSLVGRIICQLATCPARALFFGPALSLLYFYPTSGGIPPTGDFSYYQKKEGRKEERRFKGEKKEKKEVRKKRTRKGERRKKEEAKRK